MVTNYHLNIHIKLIAIDSCEEGASLLVEVGLDCVIDSHKIFSNRFLHERETDDDCEEETKRYRLADELDEWHVEIIKRLKST